MGGVLAISERCCGDLWEVFWPCGGRCSGHVWEVFWSRMGDVLATCGSGYSHVWEGLWARVGGVMGARVLGGALTKCRRCFGHMHV